MRKAHEEKLQRMAFYDPLTNLPNRTHLLSLLEQHIETGHLGDQLNSEHSWFQQVDDNVLFLIAELKQENTYVTHHIQKVCAFFSAMAQFAKEKQSEGHHVLYLTLDDTQPFENLEQLLKHYVKEVGAIKFEYQRPDEYRLLEQLANVKLEG